jgi:hypothetical protein
MAGMRHVVLLNTDSAGNGDWIQLEPQNASVYRTIQVNMNASDTITIQGTTLEADDATALAGVIGASDITTIETYTGNTDENDALIGTFTFIRAVKTGTNGVAKVQGFI